jgi:aspartate 1-decarboxylase
VHVLNENTGNRLETYVIAGNPASGVICLNGPAARLGLVGDRLIILSYGLLEAVEAKGLAPKIVYLDPKNKIKKA